MMRQDGVWHISPAYDLTFSIDLDAPAYVNRHSLTIKGKSDAITIEDLLDFARLNSIKGADKIVKEVIFAIQDFPKYAQAAGVSDVWIDKIASLLMK